MEKILIIGAGQAGMQIADSLREGGFAGSITMIGDESLAPYQRPPLSKGYLAGDVDEESLLFRSDKFYQDNQIDLVLGERVITAEIGPNGGSVTTESGKRFDFDKLALAPGSTPRILQLPGSDLDGVLYMRSIEDARKLKSRWDSAASVVVIGGGFIGLEVAAMARKAGKQVTILEAADRLMGRAVSPITSEYFRTAHLARGAEVILNAKITALMGETLVRAVQLEDGTEVPADIVMVGIGVIPRSEVAAQLGLTLERGAILVDEFARTSNPLVVAAGDAVMLPSPTGAGNLVRLESVQNAVDQAKIAATTLLGAEQPYRALPWFWSDQADLKLQIAGLSEGHDQTVLRGDMSSDSFTLLYYREGQLIAADCVNQVSDFMAVRRCLSASENIKPELAADSAVALKTLIGV